MPQIDIDTGEYIAVILILFLVVLPIVTVPTFAACWYAGSKSGLPWGPEIGQMIGAVLAFLGPSSAFVIAPLIDKLLNVGNEETLILVVIGIVVQPVLAYFVTRLALRFLEGNLFGVLALPVCLVLIALD